MKVKVTQEFQWAPDGNHVRDVKVGEVLEGRGAEVALEQKKGVELGVHQVTDRLSAATERATRAVLGVPEILRLPPLEEYVAAGYTKESYPDFIVGQAVRAGEDGGAVAIRAATEAEARELDQRRELERRETTAAAPPQVTPPSSPAAVAVPPDPMSGSDMAARAELEQGPNAPELPSRKELEKLTQPELLALALSRGLAVESDAGKGKLLKLLTAQ